MTPVLSSALATIWLIWLENFRLLSVYTKANIFGSVVLRRNKRRILDSIISHPNGETDVSSS